MDKFFTQPNCDCCGKSLKNDRMMSVFNTDCLCLDCIVEYKGDSYTALTYEMSAATKAAREGQPYPEDYRRMCSTGARFYHVPNKFIKKRKSSK